MSLLFLFSNLIIKKCDKCGRFINVDDELDHIDIIHAGLSERVVLSKNEKIEKEIKEAN